VKKIKIGILEFGVGQTNMKNVLKNLFEYAIHADALGFSRFWLGEHYLVNSLWYNPDVLIPIIAGQTDSIKVGSAGVLLSYRTPYDVALNYKLLCNLFPNRIDLGVAKGKAPKEISALLSAESDNFQLNHKIKSLVDLLNDEKLTDTGAVLVPPYKGIKPAIWSLKAGFNNLSEISDLGTSCSISLFHTPAKEADLSAEKEKIICFKEEYYNKHGFYPQINLGIAGICAKDLKTANRLHNSLKHRKGVQVHNELLGSPEYFFDKLSLYQEILGVDEFIFLNLLQQSKPRFDSLELLSKKFRLS
jgi:hypothetical protein